jgi:hypothetical protein
MNFPIDVKVTGFSSSSETPSEEPKDYSESLKTQLRKTFGADVLAPKTAKVSYVSILKVFERIVNEPLRNGVPFVFILYFIQK